MGFGVWGLGFGVWGLGFRVWGLGFGLGVRALPETRSPNPNSPFFLSATALGRPMVGLPNKRGQVAKRAAWVFQRVG